MSKKSDEFFNNIYLDLLEIKCEENDVIKLIKFDKLVHVFSEIYRKEILGQNKEKNDSCES